MLCSTIEASWPPSFAQIRNRVIEITATGIEALTVNPTFNARYSDEAPKRIPSSVPTITARNVNSRRTAWAGMKGTKPRADSAMASDGIGRMVGLGSAQFLKPAATRTGLIFQRRRGDAANGNVSRRGAGKTAFR